MKAALQGVSGQASSCDKCYSKLFNVSPSEIFNVGELLIKVSVKFPSQMSLSASLTQCLRTEEYPSLIALVLFHFLFYS